MSLKLLEITLCNKKPSSTKESMETRILRFFKYFSRIWRTRAKYKVDKIENRADSYPTPMLILKYKKEKLFQKYWVFLPTR